MAASINNDGYLFAPGVVWMPRPHIEHGSLTAIEGIIIHQTDSGSAEATLNSYTRSGANGAHFLIAKDGTVYQVASLKKKTWHVGRLRSKCLALHTCRPAQLAFLDKNRWKTATINRVEMRKSVPDRYPSNDDAIGIEIVGRCILPDRLDKPTLTHDERVRLRGQLGVFEPVNIAQKAALQRLVAELSELFHVPGDEIFRHPEVSRKNPTEAETAKWN